ncbi:MAG: glutathione peroxidase [Candidatus Sericytochromatia bacterium]|nr:glutathione peroxidase [Candidatus Sericytochromatia bacterium]
MSVMPRALPLALLLAALPAWASGLPELTLTRLEGGQVPLSRYAGKALFVANTASRCGFTGQYAGLQRLHERFGKRGLAVMGFPSNDFLGQEPGSNKEVASFCHRTYGVTFDMFGKAPVTGTGMQPMFRWLTGSKLHGGPVLWNFEKFVVDRHGRITARFRSTTEPEAPAVITAIEAALAAR